MLKAKISKASQESMRGLSKEQMHKLSVEIPKSIFSRYKAKIALDKNIKSINEHLNKCVNEYLCSQ